MARKKQPEESPEDQAKRFDAEVRRLIDAGELNPTEADKMFERAIGIIVQGCASSAPRKR